MGRKKTHEEFIKEVNEKHNNEYTILGKYEKAHIKIEIRHNLCGNIFKMRPSNFLHGQGCPVCKQKLAHQKQRYTNEQIDEKISLLVGNEYKRLSNYCGMYSKMHMVHNVCKTEFDILPVDFIHGGVRCPNPICRHNKWSESMRDNPEIFQTKFDKRSNGEYLLLSNYHLSREKIKIKHLLCGSIFEITANQFLSGGGCIRCANKSVSEKLSMPKYVFEKRLYEIHGGNISLYSEYTNLSSYAKFICNKCNHIWNAYPNNVIHKHNPTGCPICKISKGEQRINQYLKCKTINNIKQMKFNDLVGVGNSSLSYDFYLPDDNLLIEFQGKQHHEPVKAFGGEEQFKIQQEHDKRKRQYAKDHNIKLLEIWYWDFDNIEKILDKELGLVA